VPKQIVARDTGNNRPEFRNEGYFPFDVDEFYSRNHQQDTLTKLLGSRELAERYVKDSGETFMVSLL